MEKSYKIVSNFLTFFPSQIHTLDGVKNPKRLGSSATLDSFQAWHIEMFMLTRL